MLTIESGAVGALGSLAADIAAVSERVRRSVVLVRTDGEGQGSGVVWDDAGLVVTNAHVARRERLTVETSSGQSHEGKVVARDEPRDLALIETVPGEQPIELADPASLRVGELVLAVGNPLGVRGAVAVGVYCGLTRPAREGGSPGRELVRADVDLYPGNSGGPLVDASGRLIGINSMVIGPGFALAIPVTAASELVASRTLDVRRLGVSVREVVVSGGRPGADSPRAGALLVLGVTPDSAASEAGLMPGDVLLSIDGQPLDSALALRGALAASRGRSEVRLSIARGGRLEAVVVTFAADSTPRRD